MTSRRMAASMPCSCARRGLTPHIDDARFECLTIQQPREPVERRHLAEELAFEECRAIRVLECIGTRTADDVGTQHREREIDRLL